jgi:hypothetical protein
LYTTEASAIEFHDYRIGHSTHAIPRIFVPGTANLEISNYIWEAYAALMPLTKHHNETRQLYFWFFPSENQDADEEILIYLNAGISLILQHSNSFGTFFKLRAIIRTLTTLLLYRSLLQENGSFLW